MTSAAFTYCQALRSRLFPFFQAVKYVFCTYTGWPEQLLIKIYCLDKKDTCCRTACSAGGEKPQPFAIFTQILSWRVLTRDPTRIYPRKTVHLYLWGPGSRCSHRLFFSAIPVSLLFHHLFLSCTYLRVSFSCFPSRCTINSEVNLHIRICPSVCYHALDLITHHKSPAASPSWSDDAQTRRNPGSGVNVLSLRLCCHLHLLPVSSRLQERLFFRTHQPSPRALL